MLGITQEQDIPLFELNYTPENEDGSIDPISIAESLKYPDNFGSPVW
jgi:hypothetical protein